MQEFFSVALANVASVVFPVFARALNAHYLTIFVSWSAPLSAIRSRGKGKKNRSPFRNEKSHNFFPPSLSLADNPVTSSRWRVEKVTSKLSCWLFLICTYVCISIIFGNFEYFYLMTWKYRAKINSKSSVIKLICQLIEENTFLQ